MSWIRLATGNICNTCGEDNRRKINIPYLEETNWIVKSSRGYDVKNEIGDLMLDLLMWSCDNKFML